MNRRRGNESGAALIEFAMAFPVLILLMMGIVDFGMNYGNKVQAQNASRQTARAGSVSNFGTEEDCFLNGFSTSDPSAIQLACKAKKATHMSDDKVAVKFFYMGADGKETNDFSESAVTSNKYSLIVCVSAKAYSLSGILSPVLDGKFHHSRSVAKTGKPATGSFAPPAEEIPLSSDDGSDDWSWCLADDPSA